MEDEKLTVLYVDDEEVNLFFFEQIFKDEFNVIISDSPAKSLKMLNENKAIDVVVVDLNMPEMGGFEFIQKALELDSNTNVKFIILTGYAIDQQIKKALDDGTISGYIAKPFDVESVIKTIKSSVS